MVLRVLLLAGIVEEHFSDIFEVCLVQIIRLQVPQLLDSPLMILHPLG